MNWKNENILIILSILILAIFMVNTFGGDSVSFFGSSITLSGNEPFFTFLAHLPTENTGNSALIFLSVPARLLKQSLANQPIPGILSFLVIVNNGKSAIIIGTGTANGNHNPLVLS